MEEKKNNEKTDELIAQLEQEKQKYVESFDPNINLKYPNIDAYEIRSTKGMNIIYIKSKNKIVLIMFV